jgi:DNA polymerase-3 subunit epsilon
LHCCWRARKLNANFPKFNNAQKLWDRNYCIFKYIDQKGYIHLAIERYNVKKEVLKVFPDILSARSFLQEKMLEFELCAKYCHLQKTVNGCYNHEIGLCKGACVNKEETACYNERAENAIQSFDNEEHTYFIIDRGRTVEEKSVVYIEKGHYLGFGFFSGDYCNGDPRDVKRSREMATRYP